MRYPIRPLFIFWAAWFACAAGPALCEEARPAAPAERSVKEKPAEASAETAEAAQPEQAPAKQGEAPQAAVKPAEAPAKPAEAPAKPAEASVSRKEPAKELSSCAQPLVPLAEAYREAYESMQRWIREASDQTAAADERVKRLQAQIQDNEAVITKLKFEDTKENRARIKDLAKDNKQLWKDLDAARREKAALCRALSKTAGQKVRELSDAVRERLKEVQSRLD